jgi:hypothetical protein
LSALLERALRVVEELSRKLGIPAPRVVVGEYDRPFYLGGVIHLPADLPLELVERVVAHEFAHHMHEYFRVPVNTPRAEAFAQVFEEVYVRMKSMGLNYPVFTCSCGYRLFAYPGRVECPKCGRVYEVVHEYPSPVPGLERAIGLALLGAATAYFLAPSVAKYTKETPAPKTAAVTTGLVCFLAGLVL